MAKDFDASDKTQVDQRKNIAGRERAADDAVLRKLLETGDGRRWMWRLLERCHILAQPFDSDPQVTAFRLGEMNIGQTIFADVLRAAPESYMLMVKESKENA